jgi:dihydrofolate reductase
MNIILACDTKYGIGKNNQLPNWNIPGDLKRFKTLTIGDGNNVVIMGRKTYESLSFCQLKDRHNIVISRTLKPSLTRPYVTSKLDEAYCLAKRLIGSKDGKIWIIGGASLYDEVTQRGLVNRASITKVSGDYDCDVFLSKETIQWIHDNDDLIDYFT